VFSLSVGDEVALLDAILVEAKEGRTDNRCESPLSNGYLAEQPIQVQYHEHAVKNEHPSMVQRMVHHA
jgi:hypothetical protein